MVLLSLFFLAPIPIRVPPVPRPEPAPTELVGPLKRICSCETTGSPNREPMQFGADGNVLHGRVHYPDTGACQINAVVWEAIAIDRGLDIYTKEGNYVMANFIYKTEGTTPWNTSAWCWDK